MVGTKMKFFSRLSLLKPVVTAICFGIFLVLSIKLYNVFKDEPVGSSLTREPMDNNLPFPAITICDSHYQNARAFDELNFPRSPFGRPKEVLTNPGVFIDKLLLFDEKLIPNLWKYYFTLDEIFHTVTSIDAQSRQGADHRCRVGPFNCILLLKTGETATPNDTSKQQYEIEVAAGKWRSRFFSSSVDAKIYLCHTLVPNVTVKFATPGDNTISLVWQKEYSGKSIHRRVYVHDKNEEVLLNSFAIETVASVVVKREEDSDDYPILAHKKKLQVVPKLVKHPKPSDVLPCKNDTKYSENWCNIQWGWHMKIAAMKEYYGSNFTCIQPGVWYLPEKDPWPICAHNEAPQSPNNSLGYSDITVERSIYNRDQPLMTAPALGIYKSSSSCVRRCQLYTYTILEETVSAYDIDSVESDIYIYFASPVVETWTEFRLMSMLDLVSGVGGNIGLLLGMSLLSIVLLIWDLWKKIMKYSKVSHSQRKSQK